MEELPTLFAAHGVRGSEVVVGEAGGGDGDAVGFHEEAAGMVVLDLEGAFGGFVDEGDGVVEGEGAPDVVGDEGADGS